jgi:hypothetical protein
MFNSGLPVSNYSASKSGEKLLLMRWVLFLTSSVSNYSASKSGEKFVMASSCFLTWPVSNYSASKSGEKIHYEYDRCITVREMGFQLFRF